MKPRFLVGIALAALAVSPTAAAPAVTSEPTWKLDASDSSYSYVCGGDDWVAITGKGNTVTISGDCTLLELTGANNKISVESVGSIKVSGNNNDIRYTRAPAGKTKPAIKNKGKANTIRKTS